MNLSAELDALEIDLARRSNLRFTQYVRPFYEVNWHHKLVAKALDRVLSGKCRRLMIFEPPQNGKSEQVSRCFPAYALGRNPDLRIIACSYADSLAQDMSRDVQKIIDSEPYRVLFPETRLAESRDIEKRTQGQFDVVGHKGYYIGAGILGGLTGKTLDIGIVDDPVKNRKEAESETYRDMVWEQYKSAFATRQFGSEGAIVICLTRWHQDDLVGRLLKLAEENEEADQWEILEFKAVATQEEQFRKQGEPLWAAKYPLEELRRRKAGLGEYDWEALYQQNPVPSGGGLVKEEWFADKFVDASPVRARRARGWDTAGTEGDGDWTVGVRIAEAEGIFYIEDSVSGQWSPDKVDKQIKLVAELDGKQCPIREEKEGGSAGLAVISARTKTLAGWDYRGVPVTGSKTLRSKPFRVQLEAGNVRIVRGAWNRKYLKVLTSFPTGAHDDEMDATSCAFNAVLLEPEPIELTGMVTALPHESLWRQDSVSVINPAHSAYLGD